MSFRRPSSRYGMRTPGLKPSSEWLQKGVYALEYAIVFPVFFMLLYGIIAYGMAYTAKISITVAAEEGARAARTAFPRDFSASNCEETSTKSWEYNARCAARRQLFWLPAEPTIDVVQEGSNLCKVTVSYAYAANPIAPTLSLLNMTALMPETLEAAAYFPKPSEDTCKFEGIAS